MLQLKAIGLKGDLSMSQETIKLKDLIRTGHKEASWDAQYEYDDIPLVGSAHFTGHIQLTSTGVNLQGDIDATSEEPCDRCAEPYRRTIEEHLNDRFVYAALVETWSSGEKQLTEDDFFDTIGPDGILDLKDIVHQYLVMALSGDRVCNRPGCEIGA